MKKTLLFLFLISVTAPVFGVDLYQREERHLDYTYAVAIEESTDHEGEYIVGILSLGPVDQEWWNISLRSKLDKDNNFVYRDRALKQYGVKLLDNSVQVTWCNEVVEMLKVDVLTYDGWELELPAPFRRSVPISFIE